MKRLPISLAVAALLASPLAMAKTVDAVASFSILGDIVKQVGGDHVKVSTLVGPDGDPHSFEPSPQDGKKLAQADVVFVSGLGLEGWIDRLVSASGYKGQVITASQGISTRQMEEDGKAITDPHAWNSMKNGVQYATNVMNALIAADPEDANYFRQRGAEYIQQLQKLDLWAKTQFAAVPPQKLWARVWRHFPCPGRIFHRGRSQRQRRGRPDQADQTGKGQRLLYRESDRSAVGETDCRRHRRQGGRRAVP